MSATGSDARVVIPYLARPELLDACLGSLDWPADDVLVVDNSPDPTECEVVAGRAVVHRSGVNLGVAGSWNRGLDFADGRLCIGLSAAVELRGGVAATIAAWDDVGRPGCWSSELGWHLWGVTAEHRAIVGCFDPQFWPGYYEDTDYVRRSMLAGQHCARVYAPAALRAESHGLGSGRVANLIEQNRSRYIAKWGGDAGAEVYPAPYTPPSE